MQCYKCNFFILRNACKIMLGLWLIAFLWYASLCVFTSRTSHQVLLVIINDLAIIHALIYYCCLFIVLIIIFDQIYYLLFVKKWLLSWRVVVIECFPIDLKRRVNVSKSNTPTVCWINFKIGVYFFNLIFFGVLINWMF